MPEELWSARRTAEFLGVPLSTLYYWSYRGDGGPPIFRAGRMLRYDPAAVMRWLQRSSA